jgi:hypothetical protein
MPDFVKEAWFLWCLLVAGAAWITFAEHPTAKNLRTAIIDSLGL